MSLANINQRLTSVIPTDPELLNFLQANTTKGCLWVCRKVPHGCGWRLHEMPEKGLVSFQGITSCRTVREAIAAAMEKETETPDEQAKIPT